jgi:chromate transport protein ChrA
MKFLAFLTFGGAYAVLAYIAQAGVEQFGWLSAPEMMDGLGLAETTPGPLNIEHPPAMHTVLGYCNY